MPLIQGDNSDNILNGTPGDDQINGFGGDDRISPGLGGDFVDGGDGDDLLIINYSLSTGNMILNQGIASDDDMFGPGSNFIFFNFIERFDVRAGSGDDDITTGAQNDRIDTGAGNDFLDGGAGADRMTGGLGSDIFNVDNILDRIFEANEEGVDLVRTSVSYSIEGQFVENMEAISGAANVGLRGNSMNNMLTGNQLANRLNGGTGADTMIGGGGNDTYVVDNTADTVTESVDAGSDTVESSINYVLTANVENLRMTGAAIRGTGNAEDNKITGNGNSNIIDGGAGADMMYGGAGGDTYYVDDQGDRVFEASGLKGTDLVYASVSYTLAGQFVEDLILTGNEAINGAGNSLGNSIEGNGADNLLRGFAGNDTLTGFGGIDSLLGGTGADHFEINFLGNGNLTHILDFEHDTDTILLQQDFDAALNSQQVSADSFSVGTAAQDENDRIIYDPATGYLYLDSDGTGDQAAILFATVSPGTVLTATDFALSIAG